MTIRNPIYQAMVRTGGMQSLMREYENSPGTKALFDQLYNEMSVIRNLCERGVIPHEFQREISKNAVRSMHAAAIRYWRNKTKIAARRRMPAVLREAQDHFGMFAR